MVRPEKGFYAPRVLLDNHDSLVDPNKSALICVKYQIQPLDLLTRRPTSDKVTKSREPLAIP